MQHLINYCISLKSYIFLYLKDMHLVYPSHYPECSNIISHYIKLHYITMLFCNLYCINLIAYTASGGLHNYKYVSSSWHGVWCGSMRHIVMIKLCISHGNLECVTTYKYYHYPYSAFNPFSIEEDHFPVSNSFVSTMSTVFVAITCCFRPSLGLHERRVAHHNWYCITRHAQASTVNCLCQWKCTQV